MDDDKTDTLSEIEALRAEVAALRSVMDNSSTVIFLKDLEGKYLLINKRYEELFHITNDEIVGKTDYDIFPKQAADAFREKDCRALKAEKSIEEEEHVPHDDGIHTYISVKFPLCRDGKPFAVCGIATDITDRRIAEEEVKLTRDLLEERVKERTEELALFRKFAETAGQGFGMADLEGKTTYLNPAVCRFIGLDAPEQGYGKNILEFHPEEVHDQFKTEILPTVLDTGAWVGEVPLLKTNGETMPTILSLFLIRDEVGTPHRLAAVLTDLTERKRAHEQMYRADKMAALGQIIAGVAHEINNPNNFITFNLPILRKYIEAMRPMLEHHLTEDPDLRILNMPYKAFLNDVFKLLENMEHGSQRITGIVAELKNYIRSDDEKDFKIERLATVVDQVMALIGKQVGKMVKRFEVDVARDLPPVRMNPGKIEQVLINLVINAGQAADKDDAWVKLSARPAADSQFVEIRVEDNGAGIPKENIDQVFEPFFTSKSREAGTGLGLSISHQIITEHGGTIDVESTVGRGTSFVIRLPITG